MFSCGPVLRGENPKKLQKPLADANQWKVYVVVINSNNLFHQAPKIRVVAVPGRHACQGEDQAPVIVHTGR